MIVSSEAGETAYALVTIYLGSYPTTKEEKKALVSAPVSKTTLGYELETLSTMPSRVGAIGIGTQS